MAINIGANDVANNVGPTYGAGALGMAKILILAGIFEASGALIAGGDVVSTIKKGIIDPEMINDVNTFIWLMVASLFAGAFWLNLATKVGAPVSTTHSIVGAVAGAGIAAGGFGIVDWVTVGKIVASWVISPLAGGLIAAGFLYFIKKQIVYQDDCIVASKQKIPLLIAVMSWAISTYLILKGFKKVWPSISDFLPFVEVAKKPDLLTASIIGAIIALVVYIFVAPRVAERTNYVEANKDGINELFKIPLIISAAALCFAHGANDVANAIGPLAAIVDAFATGGISSKASIPLWVMMIGAGGIVIGLGFFGGTIIRKIGHEITEMSPIRAFSVAMGSTITVIVASQLGLPVSSTHIAVGGVFAIGFLKEFFDRKDELIAKQKEIIIHDKQALSEMKSKVEQLRSQDKLKKPVLKEVVELQDDMCELKSDINSEKNDLRTLKQKKEKMRKELKRIVLAWVITVPASALMAGMIFFTIRGMMM
jgi:inorganic phosphate transporter, PiT family